MRNSGILGSLVLTVLLVFCLLLIAKETFAAVDTETMPSDGKVEVIYPAERLAPYRERRGPWSTTFSLNVDSVFPDKFRSRITQVSSQDASYEDLFGDYPIYLIQAEFGLKYNFGLGSLGVGLIGGYGEVDGKEENEVSELTLFKKGATATFVLDNLFPEPYVAPYIQGQIFTFDYGERRYEPGSDGNLATNDGGTDLTSAFVLGLLIQLNWLDPGSALTAQESSGLENFFLDLYVSQYNTSSDEADPNFQTGTNFGGGLKFEF